MFLHSVLRSWKNGLWEVPWRADEPGRVSEWKEAAGGRKRTSGKKSTGTGRTDQWRERNPVEEEYSGGADDGASGVWETDRGNAGKICGLDICVWRWMGENKIQIKTDIAFLILNKWH